MNTDNLTPEFKEKAQGKTAEEMLALAQDEGIELTDEQLEAVSGGWVGRECPYCGSMDVDHPYDDFVCCDCGRSF